MVIRLQQRNYSLREGDSNVLSICVELVSGVLERDVSATVSTVENTTSTIGLYLCVNGCIYVDRGI